MSDYIKMLVHNRLEDWILDPDTNERLNEAAIEYLAEIIEWAVRKTLEEQEDERAW